jgi:hypothetical protein
MMEISKEYLENYKPSFTMMVQGTTNIFENGRVVKTVDNDGLVTLFNYDGETSTKTYFLEA